jgi:glucokinase
MSETTAWHIVGDVGGTNARFGVVRAGAWAYQDIATYQVADFPAFADVLLQLRRDLDNAGRLTGPLGHACIAVAGPPHLEHISFTNSSWRFTRAELSASLQTQDAIIINDFAAVARALPALTTDDWEQIGGGRRIAGETCAAIGPGTGTGVAGIVIAADNQPAVISGEGGHIDFAPVTDVEIEIYRRLRARFGRVSIERLLCGDGIVNIYQALADYRGISASLSSPGQIGEAARAGSDPLSDETMAIFFAVLGASAGNSALTFGARGGVFIAGGIAPRYIDLLRRSDFRARFLAKGRFADYLADIPTLVVTHPGVGLLGSALTLYDLHLGYPHAP